MRDNQVLVQPKVVENRAEWSFLLGDQEVWEEGLMEWSRNL